MDGASGGEREPATAVTAARAAKASAWSAHECMNGPCWLSLWRRCAGAAVFFVLACAATACVPPDRHRTPGACPVPACSDWAHRMFAHDAIPLVGFRKPGDGKDRLTVYIEGDGTAWRSRSRVSADPTPKNPVALRLALRDPRPGLLYLARPCQYLGRERLVRCDPSLWTSARYSQRVVTAMGRAITASKESAGDQLVLVGYSGGGVIASLLAARRSDVDLLVTVAAPLDLRAWTSHHGVSPLADSLDPAAREAGGAPPCAFHFHGERDAVVPPAIIEAYRRRTEAGGTRFFTVRGFGHHCCWARDWPELLARIPACRLQPAGKTSSRTAANGPVFG